MDPIMSIMQHVLPFFPGTDCTGVLGPFAYMENALHAFLMMKKSSGEHLDIEQLKD
ncbi:unnamed protein product, partial [Staurois parvus]